MAVFRNEFSWSKSRDILFRECRRKYWFNHYGFWNGWIASEDERTKRIYYLKKLVTKDVWVGALVHEAIEYILKKYRAGERISLGYSLKRLNKKMESDWNISKVAGYTGFKSNVHRFFEDEYGVGISDEERIALFEKARRCLINFYNSDIFMDIRRIPVEDWITLEEFLSFDFFGTRVYLSIDFAMKVGGKVVLFDWKTGSERRRAGELQLGLYAFYVSEKFKVAPENIKAKMFYLGIGNEGKVDSFDIDSDVLSEVSDKVKSSIKEMKGLLVSEVENLGVEADFERNEGAWCSRCSFRRACLGEWKGSV